MDIKDRKKIEKQLIAQAEMIGNEEDDIELIAYTVNACQALLRIVEKNMPETISNSDFEDILSGYFGLTARIKYFYQNNSEDVSDTNAKLLSELLSEISNHQRRKSDLEAEYEKNMDILSEIKKEVEEKEKEVSVIRNSYEKEKKETERLQKEDAELRAKAEELKLEKARLKDEIDNFVPAISELTNSIFSLKASYDELVAYYTVFEKIKKGIQEDGYVDIHDFTDKVKSRIDAGESLINWCDQTLSSLLTDIEALQDKIEKRRKASV